MSIMSHIVKKFMQEIANYVLYASNIINEQEIDFFIKTLLDTMKNNKKVLVVGAGRSGLAGKAF
ncbi:MAG: hypothetical protein QXQ52_06155, partial [Candidatus Methanomethylicaceae archaeon]